MSIDQHVENRAWAFEALDEVQAFLQDPDFEGDVDDESVVIDRKRKELKEGKYRVVFLGAFNVGKSTLINAFLGDEYLPTILEECTTKITHVTRADDPRILVMLTAEPSVEEVEHLSSLLNAYGLRSTVELMADREIAITFAEPGARVTLQALRALTTMSADEDYPQLRSLRDKYEELFLYVGNERLEEDIALVDSPGVHSISETNRKVAHDIIPDSHLVVCMLDSQTAGNEQSRDFIERIIKHRHRKVFFVLNKCDQLNPEEIDTSGRRGPAKDLLRSLEGIVEGPELFFVSSLYALIAAELKDGRLRLQDLDNNNKVKIPFAMMREIAATDTPEQAAADFLLDRSQFGVFRQRLLDYLYRENREGAIVQSVCRFLDNKAWRFARPLVVKLELAQNIPRLAELERDQQHLNQELTTRQAHGQESLAAYDTMSRGGRAEGREYPGYDAVVNSYINKSAVENQVLKPMRTWIERGDKFRDAKHNQYRPLITELDQRLDAFVEEVERAANHEVDAVEKRAQDRVASLTEVPERLPTRHAHVTRPALGPVQVSLAGSYFGFFLLGALLLGAAGVVAGSAFLNSPQGVDAWDRGIEWLAASDIILQPPPAATPQSGAIAGGILGALLGAVSGLLLRAMTATGSRRRKVERMVEERVMALLLGNGKREGDSANNAVREQLKEAMQTRLSHFRSSYARVFDKATGAIQEQLTAVQQEAERLREEQRQTIARLEPKIERLQRIGRDAHDIAEKGAPEKRADPEPVMDPDPEPLLDDQAMESSEAAS